MSDDHILNGRMLRDFLKNIIKANNSCLCKCLCGGCTHKLLGICGTVFISQYFLASEFSRFPILL